MAKMIIELEWNDEDFPLHFDQIKEGILYGQECFNPAAVLVKDVTYEVLGLRYDAETIDT